MIKHKVIKIGFILLALLALILITKKDNPSIEVLPNTQHSFFIKEEIKNTFSFHGSKNKHYIAKVSQCNFDIAIEFVDSNNEKKFVDRPSGNNSEEIFHFSTNNNSTFYFQVIPYDPLRKSGYIDLYISEVQKDYHFNEQKEAEKLFISGYLKRISDKPKFKAESIEDLLTSSMIYAKIGDNEKEAKSLFELGVAYNRNSKYENAIEAHLKGLNIYLGLNFNFDVASSLNEIGASYHALGKVENALFYYRKALEKAKKLQDKGLLSIVLGNIGYLYSQHGSYYISKLFFDMSFDYSKSNLLSPQYAAALQKIGLYYLNNQRLKEAIFYFKKSNEVASLFGAEAEISYLYSFINLGDAYREIGDTDLARIWALQGLSKAKSADSKEIIGVALSTLGVIEFNSRNYEKAESYYQDSLELILDDWRDNVFFLLGLTYYTQSLSDPSKEQQAILLQKAIKSFNQARMNAPDPWTNAYSYFWEARALRQFLDLGEIDSKSSLNRQLLLKAFDSKKILKTITNSLSLIENGRYQTRDQLSRISFFTNKTKFYQLFLDLLFDEWFSQGSAPKSAEIFRAAEKIRARTLLDLVNDSTYLPEHLPTAEDVNAYYDLLFQMESHFGDDAALADLEANLVPLARKMARLDADTKVIEPEAIRDAAEVQAEIGPDTKLLTYAFGLENLYLLVLDANGTQVHGLGKAEDLKDQVNLVSHFLQTHPLRRQPGSEQEYQRAMTALSKILLGPLTGLQNIDRLVFIPDQYLQRLPFAALPFATEGQSAKPLGERFQTAVLPSASVWLALKDRASKYQTPPQTIALLANPVFNNDDPRLPKSHRAASQTPFYPALPATQKEVEAIATLANGNARLAIGFAANREAVKSKQFNDYRYIHFATHGNIDPENPGQSSLVLSRFAANGQPIDGMLRLSDISQLEIHADLVSLSACETANGKMIRGEGLMSLARGFMAAGVPKVLGTLWKVPDDATAHFMTRFYEGLLRDGLTPSEALKQAQLAQAGTSKWRDPHFWAGFVLIGDWQ